MIKNIKKRMLAELMPKLFNNSDKGAISRYFTYLSAAAGAHYVLNPVPIQPTDSFVVRIRLMTRGSGGQFAYCNRNEADTEYGLNVYCTGDFDAGTGAVSMFGIGGSTPPILEANKLYLIEFEVLDGREVITKLNGIETGRSTRSADLPATWSEATQAAAGRRSRGSSLFGFTGVIAELHIEVNAEVKTAENFDSNGANSPNRINLSDRDTDLFTLQDTGHWQTVNLWKNPKIGAGGDLVSLLDDGFIFDTPNGDFVHIYVDTLKGTFGWTMTFDIDLETGSLQYTTINSGGNVTGSDIETSGSKELTRELDFIGFKRRYSGTGGGSRAKATVTNLQIVSTIKVA